MKPLDSFYQQQPEPIQSTLLALQQLILQQDSAITNEWKYAMPFFCYKGKMFCYLWVHKKTGQPYIGFVEGKYFDQPFLLQEKRSRMKIWLLDAGKDLPVKKVVQLLQQALDLYRLGSIQVGK